MSNVALVFWGLTRSLKHTYDSIQHKILDVLKTNNIQYTIFMHTYKVDTPFTCKRSQEFNCKLDNNEYKLLNPDYVKIDNQDEIKRILDVHLYRTHKDPWNTDYQNLDNFILATYSKSKATELITHSGKHFDYVIFLRPDVKFLNSFDIRFFDHVSDTSVCVPNFHLFSKMNDRFAICNMQNYEIYGNAFPYLLPYSKMHSCHSETFYYQLLTEKKISIKYIAFYFTRIRANGNDQNDISR